MENFDIDLSWVYRLVDEDEDLAVGCNVSSDKTTDSGQFSFSQPSSDDDDLNDSFANQHQLVTQQQITMKNVMRLMQLNIAQNHLVYPMPLIHPGEQIFFIEALGDILCSVRCFSIMVRSPSGYTCPVRLEPNHPQFPHCYTCKFKNRDCGNYSVEVFVGARNNPLQGSGFSIFVARNYHEYFGQTRVRINVQERYMANGNNNGSVSYKPWGIAYDPKSEQLYVGDRHTNKILVFNTNGKFLFSFGQEGSGDGQMNRPAGISFDITNKRLVVADKDNSRILFFSPYGKYLSSFGKRGHYNGQLNFPWGVAVSNDGKMILVADTRNHRVQLFDQFGNYKNSFPAINYSSQDKFFKPDMCSPRGVAFSNDGSSVYVTDFKHNEIIMLDIGFNHCTRLCPPDSSPFCRPQGIAVDAVGHLIICDSRNQCIRVLNPYNKTLVSTLRENLSNPTDADLPLLFDVVFLSNGSLAVVDSTFQIRIF